MNPLTIDSSDSDRVLVHTQDRIAIITVNDPDHRNAVTDEISADLREAVQRLEEDHDVHAIVVTGAGKAFCAGAISVPSVRPPQKASAVSTTAS